MKKNEIALEMVSLWLKCTNYSLFYINTISRAISFFFISHSCTHLLDSKWIQINIRMRTWFYARKIPLSDLLVTDKLQQHFLHEDLVYYTKGRGPGLFLTKHQRQVGYPKLDFRSPVSKQKITTKTLFDFLPNFWLNAHLVVNLFHHLHS